jgi:glycolate oxidase iron-sulfur subunit
VPYGELLEATRATMMPVRGLPVTARVILSVFARPTLLRSALWMARLVRGLGAAHLAARLLPRRLAFPFAMLASTTPVTFGSRRARTQPQGVSPDGPTRVSTLEGCVMRGIFGHVNAATERCIERAGCVVTPADGQGCCGALHAHAGDMDAARELARRNIAAFERGGAEFIVTNSAGCGAMMKGYGHLLRDDSEWAERAARVAVRTRDASEFLAPLVARPLEAAPAGQLPAGQLPPGQLRAGQLPAGQLPRRRLPLRVTHDAPCHQMHAQRVVEQPLALLNAIDGLELLPLEDTDQCCGSAGIYNLIEPETSDAVLAPKLACIRATGADYVATGNPGCMMQIGAGLLLAGDRIRVVHPLQLFDAALDAASDE